MPEEDESGNVEYKLQILPGSTERLDRLVTQLSWRLTEGGGTCVYELGVRDDGALVGITLQDMRQSLAYLCAMAQHVGATVALQRLMTKTSTITSGTAGFDTLHVVTNAEEAQNLLGLQHGLPDTEYAGIPVPQDALTVELRSSTSPVDVTMPFDQSTHGPTSNQRTSFPQAPSVPQTITNTQPSTARRRALDARRDRRLARFEATIRAGAGLADEPTRTDASRPISSLHAPEHATGSLRFLAEAVIAQDEGRFVDYTSL